MHVDQFLAHYSPHVTCESRALGAYGYNLHRAITGASHQGAILEGDNITVAPATTTSTALPLHRDPRAPIQLLALRLDATVPEPWQVRCCLQGGGCMRNPNLPENDVSTTCSDYLVDNAHARRLTSQTIHLRHAQSISLTAAVPLPSSSTCSSDKQAR